MFRKKVAKILGVPAKYFGNSFYLKACPKKEFEKARCFLAALFNVVKVEPHRNGRISIYGFVNAFFSKLLKVK